MDVGANCGEAVVREFDEVLSPFTPDFSKSGFEELRVGAKKARVNM